jgi:hypothetical protein
MGEVYGNEPSGTHNGGSEKQRLHGELHGGPFGACQAVAIGLIE